MHLALSSVFLTALAFPFLPLHAETGATVPGGFLTVTVAAGTGAGATPSVLAFPLQGIATAGGRMKGSVTGVTANTISDDNAGWTAGALSVVQVPYLFQFTSGNAAGRTFLLSTLVPNTTNIVSLDATDALSTDLTTLEIAAGDFYQIIPADSLVSILGTPSTTGVLGSATGPTSCDQVQLLRASGWISYYFNTASNHWLRASPPHTVADNVVIRPDTGVIYWRYATTALPITLTGRIPSVARKAAVFSSGPTALSNSWPVGLTLGASSIQTTPSWTAGATASAADKVQVYIAPSGWSEYFYDGAHWRLASVPTVVSDSVALPAGSMVILDKLGSATGITVLSQALPYSLTP